MNADPPADSYKIFKLLIDFIYNGNCKLECMDDILPIMEMMDRYQIMSHMQYCTSKIRFL